jgi:hypothetical protein
MCRVGVTYDEQGNDSSRKVFATRRLCNGRALSASGSSRRRDFCTAFTGTGTGLEVCVFQNV